MQQCEQKATVCSRWPDCEYEVHSLGRRASSGFWFWRAVLTVPGRSESFRLQTRDEIPPSRLLALERLLGSEANYATLSVRDFISQYDQQDVESRFEAVKEWRRLRRVRCRLKRLFGDRCP